MILAIGFIGVFLITILTSIVVLRWYNPDFTRFTMREDWSQFDTEQYSLRDYWVSADEIPEHLKWAVIASEDQLFLEHHGFDIESIREAWEERQSGERIRGASTITQQVAKNIYLTSAQSFLRKAIEAGITFFIEIFWSKERILEIYLNIAEFGPGIYGIGFASEQFWGIHASEITPEMSARLAAVLPNPKRMRVEPPSPFAEERSIWILRQMTQLSGIAYYQPEEPSDDFDDVDPYLLQADFEMEQILLSDQNDSISSGQRDTAAMRDTLNLPDLPDSLLNITETDSINTDTLQQLNR